MTFLLTIGVFAVAFLLMAVGVMFSTDHELSGSCSSDVVTPDGTTLACGSCERKEIEICPSDDELVQLAQILNPNPSHHR